MKTIKLREGKERSLLRRHPWVFQGSIAKGQADPGETVRVESAAGDFLAWASFSPSSMIRARAWSFDEAERIDHAFFKRRIQTALDLRARLPIRSNGVRLIHGEADGLPGLIVDRYADVLSVQFLSAGTERWKQAIADILVERTGLAALYERSDSGVRTLEGLQPVTGWLRGQDAAASAGVGPTPPTEVTIDEHDWKLTTQDIGIAVHDQAGQTIGFAMDQAHPIAADGQARAQVQGGLNS
ncbi:MAG: class I SAM-dependent rRNA methyltransferase, partial [Betaproteobacteria bacterium]